MEVINSIQHFNSYFGVLTRSTWLVNLYVHFQETYRFYNIIIFGVIFISASVTLYLVRRCAKKLFTRRESFTQESMRFRRRDKALFYGRKMMRKVKNISGQVRSSGQGKKRKLVMKFARRLLQLKKDTDQEQLKVLEPPIEYLQEDMLNDDRMPPDALYMLQSIRLFGHFEKPVFLRLCKHTEIVNVLAGAYLFKIGDPDEHVYIVQSGKLNVTILCNEGSSTLKTVKPGESVTSLLSFTDVLTGHLSIYKTISAKAIEDSIIVKLPMTAFQEIFKDYPDIFLRVLQVIMVRLQRVTFTALHQYLGLSVELVRQHPKHKGACPVKKRRDEDVGTGLENFTDSSTQYPPTTGLATGFKENKSNLEINANSKSSETIVAEPKNAASNSLQKKPLSMIDVSNHEDVIKAATETFVKELKLRDRSVLEGKVEIREINSGTYLMEEDSNKEKPKVENIFVLEKLAPEYEEDAALVYIISGALTVSQREPEGENEVYMFTAHPGEIVGGLAVLTGEPSFFTIKSKHFTKIALISKTNFYDLMKDQPEIVLHIAHLLVQRLSPFVRQVDFALDWIFMESGRAIYRQDDESDATYIVLSGRLRSVITHGDGKKEVVAEYGKGDLIGIVEMVTLTKRSTTVISVRDSELAKLPEGLFNAIKLKYPIIVTKLIKLLGHRILGTWKTPTLSTPRISPTVDTRPSSLNFSTVAIVAASDDVPLTAFTYELYHSLSGIGSTLRLTSDLVRKMLGTTILDRINEYRLSSWLAQQEDCNRISLYQCDLTVSAWTLRCIRQADCILIVGLGDHHPSLGKVEKEIEKLAVRTQKELVLLHREGGKPENTIAWLNMRTWVSSHHHILCQNRMFARKSVYRINELYSKVCSMEPNIHSDFSRLARWLTAKSVGLILGGGGARGAAHVGMLKAIQEAGIPIDMVGGVSIGAFMGALWCKEKSITTVTQKAREWSKKMTQCWHQILDLTYPITSMFSGKGFNYTINSTFGETSIEDLWLPYFCITTDISASCMRIHTHGSLWRYVRSSMSLSGYLPPLCDPLDGHLLLDGGYTNNLPADVMRSLGANHILAIDVGSIDDQDLTNYGDDLSGWWLLWKRWNPFAKPVKVPNLPDIQSRLAYVTCVRQLEEVKNSDYCEYIRPPIDKYTTIQFGNFDEIRDIGYHHGKAYFEGQLRAGNLPIFKNTMEDNKISINHSFENYTFTDLAQMLCKVSKPYEEEDSTSSSTDEDEGRGGYDSEPSARISKNKYFVKRSFSLSENELESDFEIDVNQ